MRLSIVQTALTWEQPEENRRHFSDICHDLKGKTDLVLLPEMFNTGFSMNTARLAEKMDGPSMHWLRNLAETLDAAVCGSFICEDSGKYHNRLIFMRPDGVFEQYDKRHLFGLSQEDQHFAAGEEQLVLE